MIGKEASSISESSSISRTAGLSKGQIQEAQLFSTMDDNSRTSNRYQTLS